jgi:hypothetical protein
MNEYMQTSFARFEAILQKNNADIYKYMAGSTRNIVAIVSGLFAIGITVLLFMINDAGVRPATALAQAPAPIIIYAQPVTAPSTPAPAKNP